MTDDLERELQYRIERLEDNVESLRILLIGTRKEMDIMIEEMNEQSGNWQRNRVPVNNDDFNALLKALTKK
jgi:hypothetical protein